VFVLKNKRFHKFVMAYSESSHQKQQKKKKTKKSMLLGFIAGGTLNKRGRHKKTGKCGQLN
jgi:hypothetical protein